MASDMQNLRDWVTHDSGAQSKGATTVLMHVTHSNLKARIFELRLDRHMTVETGASQRRAQCSARVSGSGARCWLERHTRVY